MCKTVCKTVSKSVRKAYCKLNGNENWPIQSLEKYRKYSDLFCQFRFIDESNGVVFFNRLACRVGKFETKDGLPGGHLREEDLC